jgi:integrase
MACLSGRESRRWTVLELVDRFKNLGVCASRASVEEAEIVAFLDSISPNSLKDIRDKAIFCVLLYSWCRVSALTNLSVADYHD